MAKQGETTFEQDGNKLTISRIYDAPVELVYSMFSVNENISKWWGPSTFPVQKSDMDFRVGGTWHYCMVGPGGEEAWGLSTYKEIEAPNKIVWTDAFSDADGNIDPNLPQSTVHIELSELYGKTLMVIWNEYDTADQVAKVVEMGMLEGIKDTSAQLERLLAAAQA